MAGGDGPVAPGTQVVLDALDLEELDRNLYRGPNVVMDHRPTLYGGQVAAQAVAAAARTVEPGRMPHSLHGYFLRPGTAERPVILHVDRDRDGRSFSARHVVAVQNGEVIFSALVSFHAPEDGVAFSALSAPTGVPRPDDLPDEPDEGHNVTFHLKRVGGVDLEGRRAAARMWVRTRGPVADDPILHACLIVYLSDMGSGFAAVEVPGLPPAGPSIDHTVWLHRIVRPDAWLLLDQWPVHARANRGLYLGAVYTEDGDLAATIAQEALLRPRRDGITPVR